MGARIKVVLACETCGRRNYKTSRSAAPDAKAIEMKKFCAACKGHKVHHESR